MCGLAGVLDRGGITPPGVLQAMTATLAHRGPDGQGFYEAEGIHLGHRRLAIVDLAGGAQPMANEDGTVVVIFNGEIYNHAELRRELADKGHRFRTRSDTEVLVHLYEEAGPGMLTRLNGMFAFALWDEKRGHLFLARDRLGIKPLYYAALPGHFLFASELKALLAHPAFPRTVRPEAVADYLQFLYVPGPGTIFTHARKLPPGSWLLVGRDGATRSGRYWEPPAAAAPPRAPEALWEVVTAAVRRRLMADVPLGAFLSGGLDSSTVVAAMKEAGVQRPATTTVGFTVARVDERPAAAQVAAHLGTDHHEVLVTPDAQAALAQIVYYFDEPFADPSAVPTYYLSAAARERVTVALSGDGGDETHAGYRRYRFEALEGRMRRLLGRPGRAAAGVVGRWYPRGAWLPQPLRARTLLVNLARPPAEAYARSLAPIPPELARALLAPDLRSRLRDYDPTESLRDLYARAPAADPVTRAQWVDLQTYLPDDILTKVDRASMAHGLEVRVPFLDHEHVAFALRLPRGQRLRRRHHKVLLKEAVRPYLPRAVVERSKQGFEVPLREWCRRELRPLLAAVLADGELGAFVDTRCAERLLREHRLGVGDHGVALWAVLVLGAWVREHLAARPLRAGERA